LQEYLSPIRTQAAPQNLLDNGTGIQLFVHLNQRSESESLEMVANMNRSENIAMANVDSHKIRPANIASAEQNEIPFKADSTKVNFGRNGERMHNPGILPQTKGHISCGLFCMSAKKRVAVSFAFRRLRKIRERQRQQQ
jgi:hypothetical protein